MTVSLPILYKIRLPCTRLIGASIVFFYVHFEPPLGAPLEDFQKGCSRSSVNNQLVEMIEKENDLGIQVAADREAVRFLQELNLLFQQLFEQSRMKCDSCTNPDVTFFAGWRQVIVSMMPKMTMRLQIKHTWRHYQVDWIELNFMTNLDHFFECECMIIGKLRFFFRIRVSIRIFSITIQLALLLSAMSIEAFLQTFLGDDIKQHLYFWESITVVPKQYLKHSFNFK